MMPVSAKSIIWQLFNEIEYDLKNYVDRGGCRPRRITPFRDLGIILQIVYLIETTFSFKNYKP